MTRATRSQAVHHSQGKSPEQLGSPQLPKKHKESKKRKRVPSASEAHDIPLSKQPRTDSEVKEIGGLTLDGEHAQWILEILEEIDTQGLLDRIFPLPSPRSNTSNHADGNAYSLRTLLKEAGMHDTRLIRAAIQPLYPISSHPRARVTRTAKQQREFCDLALHLLDEVSQQASSRISLQNFNLFPDSDTEQSWEGRSPSASQTRRRYALMQKLPSGEYWTSVDAPSKDGRDDIKRLVTAHAQRVSVLPSLPPSITNQPTLGSYILSKKSSTKSKKIYLQPRSLSKGDFLDYGPFSSFAPSWDSEGGEVGRDCLGAVAEAALLKRSKKAAGKQRATHPPSPVDSLAKPVLDPSLFNQSLDNQIERLLSENDQKEFLSFTEGLQIETGIDELLEKSAYAIRRLQYLQDVRLLGGEAVNSRGLENDTAAVIADTLHVLTSTRPSSVTKNGNINSFDSPILPSPSDIQNFRTTLPICSTDGWHGTLAEGRRKALRDDSTIYFKPSTSTTKPAASNSSNPPTASTTPYRAGYPYYPLHTVNGQPNYYPSAYAAAPYPSTNPGQTPYPYAGTWGYGFQPPSGMSKTGTPIPPNYASYYPMQTQLGQRAVANTAKPLAQQANGWASALPAHIRRVSKVATPTPTPVKHPTQQSPEE